MLHGGLGEPVANCPDERVPAMVPVRHLSLIEGLCRAPRTPFRLGQRGDAVSALLGEFFAGTTIQVVVEIQPEVTVKRGLRGAGNERELAVAHGRNSLLSLAWPRDPQEERGKKQRAE